MTWICNDSMGLKSNRCFLVSISTTHLPGACQTKAFFDGDTGRFCTIGEQSEMIANYYLTMSGYEK